MDGLEVLGVRHAHGQEEGAEREASREEPARRPRESVGENHGQSSFELLAACEGAGHERGANTLGGQELRHGQERAGVAALIGVESGEDHGVAGELLVGAQVVAGPPGDGVPPKGDPRQPLDPADPVVTALDVGQLMGEDEAQVRGGEALHQGRRHDDPRRPGEAPDVGADARGGGPHGGGSAEPEAAADAVAEALDLGGRGGGRAAHGDVELDDAEEGDRQGQGRAQEPGPAGGAAEGGGLAGHGGRGLVGADEAEGSDLSAGGDRRREGGQLLLHPRQLGAQGGALERDERDGQHRRRHELEQDPEPQRVGQEGVPAVAMYGVCDQGQGRGDADVAQGELQPEGAHVTPSRGPRRRSGPSGDRAPCG